MLIAPAVDFTELLMWQRFPAKVKKEIETSGVWARPSRIFGEPYLITRSLIEEGRNHLLLGGMIETGCPVRILQGVQDPDVPWSHAVELTSRLAQDDVVLTLVKDGDHRLSRPEDLERLIAAVAEFSAASVAQADRDVATPDQSPSSVETRCPQNEGPCLTRLSSGAFARSDMP